MNQRSSICIAGDSGDGVQLTAKPVAHTLANHYFLVLQPDYPAEIRAPAGSVDGVSSLRLAFCNQPNVVLGAHYDVLICFNAAALKVHLPKLSAGGYLLLDESGLDDKSLSKVGLDSNAISDNALSQFTLVRHNFAMLTLRALQDHDLDKKSKLRCKNFFTLGILFWMYAQPLDAGRQWLEKQFANKTSVLNANLQALQSGYFFAETLELPSNPPTDISHHDKPLDTQLFRVITGNQATALAIKAATYRHQKEAVFGAYPITPASDILHELSDAKGFPISTVQMEDEIAAAGLALGAAFAGRLGVTATSGPGLSLKMETINLAVMAELPLVVVNVQRAGPSTGMPTKTEQSDLRLALFGRHGDSAIPVLAPMNASDCYDITLLAFDIAVEFMTPVIVLSDATIAMGAQSWSVPDIPALYQKNSQLKHSPFSRDARTYAREWVAPGTEHGIHRTGGLEKDRVSGKPSHDAQNHQLMTKLRAQKLQACAAKAPKPLYQTSKRTHVLLVSWGSTFATINACIDQLDPTHEFFSHMHLRCLQPLPKDLADIFNQYTQVVSIEQSHYQFRDLLQSHSGRQVVGYQQVDGQPLDIEKLIRYLQPMAVLKASDPSKESQYG